ncbi:facilitated trehalose transporter Tret1-like [Bombus bifarius]|uniref:Facilitated trehalose transporter Tret1-like n=1 Tax=Bombus bifarius TaxID=103933 RepID=A0A6P8MG35_9HYME|nr:facilitated trehalose transporter Tret1-like [Bombus bifarius]
MHGTEYTCMTKLQVILHRNYRKALYIMFGLTMAQQLSGNFITTQYLEVLFRKITIVIDPHVATILVLFVSFVSGSLTFFAVQFVGRRTLLLLSTGGTCITLTILAIYLVLFGNLLQASNVSIIPVIDLIIYQVVFEIGLGTLPNVLLCELFPTELKGFAGVINVTFDGTIGLIVLVLYKLFIDNLGSYTIYFIFATSCFLAFLMVFIWVPETKGKTYNEIEALLAGEI